MARCKTFKQVNYIVRAYCESCGGELIFNGERFNGNIKRYGHTCAECDEHCLLVEIFPHTIEKEEVEVNEIM